MNRDRGPRSFLELEATSDSPSVTLLLNEIVGKVTLA
jgi:hypothetical protein